MVPTSVLGPAAGVIDGEPTSPVTDVGLAMVSAVPASTPKSVAVPNSKDPGPRQLTGNPGITVNNAVPGISVDGSVAVIVMGPPNANPVANPLKPDALLMVALPVSEEVQVTDDVRFCVGPAVNVPVAIYCCVSPT